MIKRKIVTTTLVTVGLLVSLEYKSIAQQTAPTSQPNQTTLSKSDRQFVIEAAQGGIAEVTLGQIATKRAVSNEVKQYAQHMIDDHTKANAELMQLAKRKDITVLTNMDAKRQALITKISKLSGKSFDQAYMNEVGVKSHAGQAALYQREVQQGQDSDLKAFAAKILPTVQEHLQMARNMTGKTTGVNHSPSGSHQMKEHHPKI